MVYDVVVVGGGIGGLSTAALLAKNGRKVLLLERSSRLGGRASSYEYKGGFTVDWGIHMCRYGREGEAAATLEELGEDLEFKSPGMKYYFYEAGKLRGMLSGGLKIFSFSALAPALRLLRKVRGDVEELLDVSLKDWLSEQTESEDARRIFDMLSASLIITPLDKFDASLGEMVRTIRRMRDAGEGAAYPVGGWKTIIDKLVKVIEDNGGEIRTRTKADSVIVKEGVASGAKVDGETIDADKIVLGIRHQLIDGLVEPKHLPEDYLERCRSLKPNAGISVDIGTSKVVTDVDGLILSSEVPLIGAVTSNIDPSVAPEGKQLMTFLFIHSPEELEDKEFVRGKIEEYRRMIYRMIPGLEGNVEWKRVLRMKCVDGVALTPDQNYRERPGIETPIDNLYFASDTCGVPGGGGDISFASARECAKKILEDDV